MSEPPPPGPSSELPPMPTSPGPSWAGRADGAPPVRVAAPSAHQPGPRVRTHKASPSGVLGMVLASAAILLVAALVVLLTR